MSRVALLACVIFTAGCRLPPDGEALRALPENRVYSYDELLARARAQATAAVEAFYIDSWRDLEDSAAALEQTARFLPKTANVPASLQDKLNVEADTLLQDAAKLADAARGRNVREASESLQRINLKVRQLRPREATTPERLSPAGRLPERPPEIETTPKSKTPQ
jgi:hypothetical protein